MHVLVECDTMDSSTAFPGPDAMTRFDTTRWSIVLRARGEATDARAALDALCRRYRPPVLAYIRRRGHTTEDAEDLAQSFFVQFVGNATHTRADSERGSFRAFLLTTLKRFLRDADEAAHALKRGGAMQFKSLTDETIHPEDVESLADPLTPEGAFEHDWAATVLEAAMQRLRAEARQAGKLHLFDQLSEFLLDRAEEGDYARAADALQMRRNALGVAVHRLRGRLREFVRDELAQTTASRAELESELRHLRKALNSVMPAAPAAGNNSTSQATSDTT